MKRIQKNQIEINTRDYERNHGAAPKGRGSWAFCLVDPNRRNDYLDFVIWASGTYAAARRAAVSVLCGQAPIVNGVIAGEVAAVNVNASAAVVAALATGDVDCLFVCA